MNLKKITAVIMALIGVVVIILGATMMKDAPGHSVSDASFRYSADYYNADGASFGADFYTYIYDASDIMVDELNDINNAMETVVSGQSKLNQSIAAGVRAADDLIDTVNHVGGMIVIAIGLAILAYAVQALSAAFAPVSGSKQEDEIVEEVVAEEAEPVIEE